MQGAEAACLTHGYRAYLPLFLLPENTHSCLLPFYIKHFKKTSCTLLFSLFLPFVCPFYNPALIYPKALSAGSCYFFRFNFFFPFSLFSFVIYIEEYKGIIWFNNGNERSWKYLGSSIGAQKGILWRKLRHPNFWGGYEFFGEPKNLKVFKL